MQTQSLARTLTRTLAHSLAHALTRTRVCLPAPHSLACMRTHSPARTLEARTHTRSRARRNAHMHAHTHTRSHARSLTHMHAHIHVPHTSCTRICARRWIGRTGEWTDDDGSMQQAVCSSVDADVATEKAESQRQLVASGFSTAPQASFDLSRLGIGASWLSTAGTRSISKHCTDQMAAAESESRRVVGAAELAAHDSLCPYTHEKTRFRMHTRAHTAHLMHMRAHTQHISCMCTRARTHTHTHTHKQMYSAHAHA